MTKITTQCPTCEKQFQVPPEFVGKTATCSKCKLKFTVEPFLDHRSEAPRPASPAPAPSRQLPPAMPSANQQPVVVHKTTGCLKVSLIGAGIAGVLMLLLCGGMMSLLQKASDANKKRLEAMTPEERQKLKDDDLFDDQVRSLERSARELIVNRLKAPTTAKVDLNPVYDDRRLAVMYVGKVTSQNSFGAMLTKPVTITYGRRDTKSDFSLVTYQFESEMMILDEELYQRIKHPDAK